MKNRYFLLRHGQALSNVKNIISCWPEKKRFPLTKEGREQVKKAVKEIDGEKIDLIFSSDLLRTRQTAEIASKILKIKLRYDKRLREYNMGVFNGRLIDYYRKSFPDQLKRFYLKPEKGENYNEIEERMLSFVKDMEKKYKDKSILVVSHQLPIAILLGSIKELPNKEIVEKYIKNGRIRNGEVYKI